MWTLLWVSRVSLCSRSHPQTPLNSLSNSRGHSSGLIYFLQAREWLLPPLLCLYLWPFWVLEETLLGYSSDLPVFLTHEEWGKGTGWDFHCKKWRLWILKVSGTLETTWLVQLCLPTSQQWGGHSFERLPLSMLGGSSHWEVLSYWTDVLVWDSTKQVRANLKVQFVETSQQIIPPITLV